MTTYTNTGANRLVGLISGVTHTLAAADLIDLQLAGIDLGATGGTGFVIRIPDEQAIAFDLVQGSASYMRVNTTGGSEIVTFGGGTTTNPDFLFNGTGTFGQSASGGQVTFTGNVDAQNGLDVTTAALTAAAGATVSGAGSVGGLRLNNSIDLVLGTTGTPLTFTHNGTNSILTSTTGYLLLDNTNVTGATHIDLGTDTSATQFDVRNNTGTVLMSVKGDGEVSITYPMRMPESSTPSTPSNAGFIYVKDVSGSAELFYLGDTVGEVQLTTGGEATPLLRIGASTYVSAQDLQTIFHSAGSTSGGTITSSGGGTTFDVASGTGLIRTSDSKIADLKWFDWATVTGIAITDGQTKYVGVEYNAGSPQVYSSTDPFTNTTTWNLNTRFPLGVVTREATTLHITHSPQAVGDHANFMIQRDYFTMPYDRDERTGGLVIGETGTRKVTLSGGSMWDRLNKFPITAIDTNVTGGFDRYYRDGDGGFAKEAAQTQWPNTMFAPNNQISGTVAGTATTTTLTGTTTAFTTELKAGDTIILDPGGVNEETRIVDTITDNDTLDVTVALTNTHTTSTVRRILGGLTTAYYGSLWWYLESDGNLVMMYGEDEFSTAALAATDAVEPGLKPPRLNHDQARLVGRFIFQKSASTVDMILTAWDSMGGGGGGGGVTDHGNLSGLGDDDHLQYLLVSGTRAMSGNLQLGTNAITGVTTITENTSIFPEQGSDPANTANQGKVYTKDVSAITELFYLDSTNATPVQITSNGSLNAAALTFGLQEAYVDGNTITTSAGEGNLTVNGTEDFIVGGSVDTTFSTSGVINQTGAGQVTFTGNVDANGGVDVLSAGNFTHAGTGTGTISRAWTWDTVGQTVTLNDGVELRFGSAIGGDTKLYWENGTGFFVVDTGGLPAFHLGHVVVANDTTSAPLPLAGTTDDMCGIRSVVKSAVANLPTYGIVGRYNNVAGIALTDAAAVNAAVRGWVETSATDTNGSYTSFLANATDNGGAAVLRGLYVGPNFDMGLQVDSGAIDLNPTAAFTLDMTGTFTAKITVADNTATAFQVKEGSNNYLDVTTTNGSEAVNIGNSTTKPDLNATVGSSVITLGDTMGVESLAIKNSAAATKFSVSSLGDVIVKGNLTVDGTTTSVNSEEVNIADNHLYLNADYTTAVAQTGGLVVNYLPIATSTTTAGAFVAGTTALTPITGSVSGASGQTQITGLGTSFQSELQVGWSITIDPGGVPETKVIASITSDLILDVVGNLANTHTTVSVDRLAANPKVTTSGSGTFSTGQLIQVSGATVQANDGLYEVLSHTGTNLVIRGIGGTACVEDFTENQFTYDAATGATITRVTVSALRAGVDGVWEMASGATTGFTFVNLTTAATGTLQAAYEAGNSITVSDGEGPLTIQIDTTVPVANMTVRDESARTYFETDATNTQLLLGEATTVNVVSEGAFSATEGATVSGGAFTFNGTSGSWTMAQATSSLTQVGTGQVTFTGNVDAGRGLDVTGGPSGAALSVVGASDANVLYLKSNATQTANVIDVWQSDGSTFIMTLANNGNLTAAGTITAGSSSVVINGNTSPRTIQTNSGALTVTANAGDLTLASATSGAVNVSSVGTVDVQAVGAVTIDSSAGTIGIGTDANAFAINIGTAAAQRTITIGNTTGASALNLTSGTGAQTFTSGGIFDVNSVGAVTLDSSAGTIGIGTNADAFGINIGTGAAARTITMGNGTGATSLVLNAGTGAINIGTNAIAHTTTIGNGTGASSVVLESGTGPINIGINAVAHAIDIGNNTGATSVAVTSGTGGIGLIGATNGLFRIDTGTLALETTTSGSLNLKSAGTSNYQIPVATAVAFRLWDGTDNFLLADSSNDRLILGSTNVDNRVNDDVFMYFGSDDDWSFRNVAAGLAPFSFANTLQLTAATKKTFQVENTFTAFLPGTVDSTTYNNGAMIYVSGIGTDAAGSYRCFDATFDNSGAGLSTGVAQSNNGTVAVYGAFLSNNAGDTATTLEYIGFHAQNATDNGGTGVLLGLQVGLNYDKGVEVQSGGVQIPSGGGGVWLNAAEKVKYGGTYAAPTVTSYWDNALGYWFGHAEAGDGTAFITTNSNLFVGGSANDYMMPLTNIGQLDSGIYLFTKAGHASSTLQGINHEMNNTTGIARSATAEYIGAKVKITPKTTANITGTATITGTPDLTYLTGSGTSFLTQLGVGDTIIFDPAGSPVTRVVASIISDVSLTVTVAFPGTIGTGKPVERQGDNAAAVYKGLTLNMDGTTGVSTAITVDGTWDTGLKVNSGGIDVAAGGLTVTAGTTLLNGGLTLTAVGLTMTGLDIGGPTAAEVGDIYTDGYIRFGESAVDPANVAGKGFVYTKDVSGSTELFYRGDPNAAVQLTSGGVLNLTLQSAYVNGNTITANDTDGNVEILLGASGSVSDFQVHSAANNFIWADVSANLLYLGAASAVPVRLDTNTQLQFGGTGLTIVGDGSANLLMTNSVGNLVFESSSIAGDINLITTTTGSVGIEQKLASAAAISVGMAVYISGTNAVTKANAVAASSAIIGGIALNAAGGAGTNMKLAVPGSICDIIVEGTAPSVGDVMYLSATTAGSVTKTAPNASASVIYRMGVIVDTNRLLYMPQFIAVNP